VPAVNEYSLTGEERNNVMKYLFCVRTILALIFSRLVFNEMSLDFGNGDLFSVSSDRKNIFHHHFSLTG
jgi:hypothetical protein